MPPTSGVQHDEGRLAAPLASLPPGAIRAPAGLYSATSTPNRRRMYAACVSPGRIASASHRS
jgi:hypothetical protein